MLTAKERNLALNVEKKIKLYLMYGKTFSRSFSQMNTFGMFTISGSTSVCEQVFLNINFIKNEQRR